MIFKESTYLGKHSGANNKDTVENTKLSHKTSLKIFHKYLHISKYSQFHIKICT